MIFIISGLVLAALLIILAAIQTTLEIAEDARAGALSIARALLLSALAGFWLVFAVECRQSWLHFGFRPARTLVFTAAARSHSR